MNVFPVLVEYFPDLSFHLSILKVFYKISCKTKLLHLQLFCAIDCKNWNIMELFFTQSCAQNLQNVIKIGIAVKKGKILAFVSRGEKNRNFWLNYLDYLPLLFFVCHYLYCNISHMIVSVWRSVYRYSCIYFILKWSPTYNTLLIYGDQPSIAGSLPFLKGGTRFLKGGGTKK